MTTTWRGWGAWASQTIPLGAIMASIVPINVNYGPYLRKARWIPSFLVFTRSFSVQVRDKYPSHIKPITVDTTATNTADNGFYGD
jgi:hypothetical protein